MLEKEDEVEELEDELHAHDCLVGGGAAEDAVGQELRVELEEEEDELGYLGVSLSTQVAQREQVLEDRILFLALEQLAHTYSFDNVIRAPFVAVVVADFTPWYSHSVDVFKTLAGGWDNEDFGGPGGNFGSAGSAPIGQPYVVGIVDGSAKETGTPGSGDFATWLAAQHPGCTPHLLQQAWYNGNYGFHGCKLQHYIDRIPKMLADQAYAPGRNVSPKSKERSLNAMADPVAAAALRDRDLLNAPYRATVETSFDRVATQFPQINVSAKSSLMKGTIEGGRSNYKRVASKYSIMVFFNNLRLCWRQSSQEGQTHHIKPPTIQEYLYNTNNNRMMVDMYPGL
eukprot:gene20418-20839_t